ncbi:MAG: hypothetical protein D6737_01755 [Chloroflexi bacterium]|nr:MAG: hypothetical protein D6737_01755 [Chloroflexota bacterium]
MAMLKQIIESKLRDIEDRQARRPMEAIRALAEMQARPQPVLNTVTGGQKVLIIGQVRQSLSDTGALTDAYDPVSLGLWLVQAGAEAIALFTDDIVYEHGLDDLTLLTRAISVPGIVQDYVLNEYHLVEARAAGASGLFLSTAVLPPKEVRNLISAATRNRMTAIVEVHNEEQLKVALAYSPHVIGIGNRDPENHTLDLENVHRLRRFIPSHIRVMPTGALQTWQDVAVVANLRVDAVLVGKELISSPADGAKLRDALNRSNETMNSL